MDQTYTFQITPINGDAVHAQVSYALEKRTEFSSRKKFSKLWELTDRLNSVEKVPSAVRENRRKRRAFLGFWDWMLGILLLTAGLMEPRQPLLLLVGAAASGFGTVYLWRYQRRLLALLNFLMGPLYCFGALGNSAELRALLPLGIAGIAAGTAAFLTRKQADVNPFDQAATRLLSGRDAVGDITQFSVSFQPEGMVIYQDQQEKRRFSYAECEVILETEDLLLPVFQEHMILLQKKDLLTGSMEDLNALLQAQAAGIFFPIANAVCPPENTTKNLLM